MKLKCALFLIGASLFGETMDFNENWQFWRLPSPDAEPAKAGESFSKEAGAVAWEAVTLPHTAFIEPALVNDQWTGLSYYRKDFELPQDRPNSRIYVEFGAAMQEAGLYVNGQWVGGHKGGYLPFVADITDFVKVGETNSLSVRLDNRFNANIPPGKPLKTLDFNWFSGLYRNAKLIVKDELHITHPLLTDEPAKAGILVTFPEATNQSATVNVQTELWNSAGKDKNAVLKATLLNHKKEVVASAETSAALLLSGEKQVRNLTLKVKQPNLWSPKSPYLYDLVVETLANDTVTDREVERIGIRRFELSAKGFFLNGEKMYLRGTNRHQEYPYVGYALSDAMNYRDARKIKEAGFDLVRLSHYPQSTSFMEACDELGLIAMNAIPGWQMYRGGEFAEMAVQNTRDMVRRDRNHASSIFWEASLNESGMPDALIHRLHNAVKEELPGDQNLTCGWVNKIYDFYIPARQHAKGPVFWDNWKDGNKAMFTAEYGDWEYYANQAANFNQSGAKELTKEEITSRQRRSDGEVRLLQMAMNLQESHNQNHKNPANFGDANWVFFDYNRGYADDHCESGLMDLFRLPKFGYYFYRSQRPYSDPDRNFDGGPMVFIASYWQQNSPLNVRVFSNCDEVELKLNGKTIARQKPDQNQFSTYLNEPPFTFNVPSFAPGKLEAIGYVKGKKASRHIVRTPEAPQALKVVAEPTRIPLQADGTDALFVYAQIVDKNGTVVPQDDRSVQLSVKGGVAVSPVKVDAEAGIASFLIRADRGVKQVQVMAQANGVKAGQAVIPVQNR